MSYEVSTRTIASVPFLYMKRSIQSDEIATALGEMFGAVFQYATSRAVPFAGPPTARYPSFGPGLITIEAGMPVGSEPASEGDILLGALHGGRVATTVHKGPYDHLSQAHVAIERWLAEEGEQPQGGPWEVYVTDPGEVPDPAEWLTEVNWPLA